MHRRSFLSLLATSTAAVAFPSIVRAETLGLNGGVAPSNRINLGYIGVGNQGGGHFHAELNNPLTQTVAICDVDGERLANAKKALESAYADKIKAGSYSGVFTTGDFRELIARPEVDAVWISVPDHWHALPLIHAAQAGKDIYAEKPLSLTIPEGQAMVRAVQSSGVVCQIGSQQRSSSEFQRIVQLARNGVFGKITSVKVGLPGGAGPSMSAPLAAQTVPADFDYNFWLGPAPEAPYYKERCHWNFRWIFDYSGGQLTDWIGHHCDIAMWAMDLTHTGPVAIKNAKAQFPSGPLYNTAYEYSFEAHFANGTVLDIGSHNPGGLRIEGSNGWAHANRGVFECSSPEFATMSFPTCGFHLDSTVNHTQNFLNCVASRQTPICPIDQALRVVTVAHLANLCFRTGRSELNWDPDAQQVIDAPDAAALLRRDYRAPWSLPV
jgi:predicted dehydrogenase